MKWKCLLLILLFLFTKISFGQLAISSVYDGPLTGGLPKGIELYVVESIADLSIYGIGSANNGGGTDGEEYTFPAVSVTAGTYIYVASEAVQFPNWFGFAPDYTSGYMEVNGDDAIELFKNGNVIDLYGDINVDGNGEPWEYLDGWGLSNTNRVASPTFNPSDWSYSGANAWDDDAMNTNATSTPPLLVGTVTPTPVELTSFTATSVDGGVILNWATATEVNNYGFSVEQNSILFPEWKEIAFIEGHGNSNSPKQYSFFDASVAERSPQMGAYGRSYRLKQIDTDGLFEYFPNAFWITVAGSNANTELFQNHPNPFNPSTIIRYEIQDTRFVSLKVYNILGENVATLVDEIQNAGSYEVLFNASVSRRIASGFYFYRLESESFTKTMKMLLIK